MENLEVVPQNVGRHVHGGPQANDEVVLDDEVA